MTCDQARPLLGAYVDHELDARASLELEEHLEGCASCRAAIADLRALGDGARAHLDRFPPTPAFERRAAAAIRPAPRRRLWLGAASAALAVAAAFFLFLRMRDGLDRRVADEIMDAHTRSLLADHITDVRSTDQHTVKPWFNGKVPYGVPVADFAAQGFPLVGGRLDYVGGREVAALVYHRRSHVINAFVWPGTGSETPRELVARGYSVLEFGRAGLVWWLISDAASEDLVELQHLLATID